MLKLADLLKELDLPKNKWIPVPHNELKDFEAQIYELIKNAYASIGGHPNYKDASSVSKEAADTDFEVIDLDDDSEIDAVTASKKTQPALNM
jgi:6-phosphogluconate dehydrogenase (decarboxylating)